MDFFDDTTEAMGDLMDEFGADDSPESKQKFGDMVTKYNKARMRFLSRITIYAKNENEIDSATNVMWKFNEILDKIDEKTNIEKNDKEQIFTTGEFNILYEQFSVIQSFYSSWFRHLKIEYNV